MLINAKYGASNVIIKTITIRHDVSSLPHFDDVL